MSTCVGKFVMFLSYEACNEFAAIWYISFLL